MPAEIAFLAAAEDGASTAGSPSLRPTVVCSVSQAFDVIDGLPESSRRRARWRDARKALRRLLERPDDCDLARAAADAFRGALLEEGWFG